MWIDENYSFERNNNLHKYQAITIIILIHNIFDANTQQIERKNEQQQQQQHHFG